MSEDYGCWHYQNLDHHMRWNYHNLNQNWQSPLDNQNLCSISNTQWNCGSSNYAYGQQSLQNNNSSMRLDDNYGAGNSQWDCRSVNYQNWQSPSDNQNLYAINNTQSNHGSSNYSYGQQSLQNNNSSMRLDDNYGAGNNQWDCRSVNCQNWQSPSDNQNLYAISNTQSNHGSSNYSYRQQSLQNNNSSMLLENYRERNSGEQQQPPQSRDSSVISKNNHCRGPFQTSDSTESQPYLYYQNAGAFHTLENSISDAETGQKEMDVNVTTDDPVNETDVDIISNEHENVNVLAQPVSIQPKHKLGCDNSAMFVKTSSDLSPKKLCCPFCDKLFIQLAKHMERKHKQEPDVQNFLSFPKGSTQRRAIQDSLRKIGTFNWNMDFSKNKGELIPSRRPNIKYNSLGIVRTSCPYCKGAYTKSYLRHHVRSKCLKKPTVNCKKSKGERILTALATSTEARYNENVSDALKKVFIPLRNNAVSRIIKFDWLITVYGNALCRKYTRPKNKKMIRSRLRLVGRILQQLKLIQPDITEFATLYLPEHYDCIVAAIKAVARYNVITDTFGAPGTASSSVTAVKQIGKLLIAEYIRKGDQEKRRVTRDYLELMETDIHISINKTVNENQSQIKRRKGVTLPSMDDVKKLSQYIEAESNKCFEQLSKSFECKTWSRLSELTAASIIVFNRKRVGDTEDIIVDEFNCREVMNHNNAELFELLSEESKEIAQQYSRMTVRGKKKRDVPVLLKADMEEKISLILSYREEAGISSNNEFLFALPSSIDETKCVNACTALNKFARSCGAKNPSTLTSTNMRKHMATFCVSLELNDTEVADVADFMGHAEKVHREVYRQNTLDRQIVNMSKVLEAAQGNVTSVAQSIVRTVQKRKTPTSRSIKTVAAKKKSDGRAVRKRKTVQVNLEMDNNVVDGTVRKRKASTSVIQIKRKSRKSCK